MPIQTMIKAAKHIKQTVEGNSCQSYFLSGERIVMNSLLNIWRI
jgi:hypothetical protein